MDRVRVAGSGGNTEDNTEDNTQRMNEEKSTACKDDGECQQVRMRGQSKR